MDPMVVTAIINGLFGIGAGALSAPQERTPFYGVPAEQALRQANIRTQGVWNGLLDLVSRGMALPSAYAQTPPTFTGGGLPMPIGVSGVDPALASPALLKLAGISFEHPNPPGPGDTGPTPGTVNRDEGEDWQGEPVPRRRPRRTDDTAAAVRSITFGTGR